MNNITCEHDWIATGHVKYTCPLLVEYKCLICGKVKDIEEGGIKIIKGDK